MQRLIWLIFLTIASSSPSSFAAETEPTTSAAEQPAAAVDAADDANYPGSPGYVLKPGDVLQITTWKETELSGEVVIRPDGGMSFALAGELHPAGLTVAELTVQLQQHIRKYVPDAVVTVAVKAALGNRVYVIGKVTRPGDFQLNGPLDVMQALALAGGATPFADLNGIRILRRDGARQSSIPFHYTDIQKGKKLDHNILLQSGDTVVVP